MAGKVILGCIADDFTGASDAASFLAAGGMQTILFNGIPKERDKEKAEQADAVVIALKTRTQEPGEAVKDSLAAVRWLRAQGVRQLYIKYCSTFDSTSEGNIGPIVDAVMELCGAQYTVLCPSLPVNGRTVQDGCLFVNGIPLAQSPMKDHPLTPMRESDITRLMQAQSQYSCVKLSGKEMAAGRDGVDGAIAAAAPEGKVFYLVPDFVDAADAAQIVALFGDLPVLTGGSGLLTALAEHHRKKTVPAGTHIGGTVGPGIVLAGSCSKVTLAQIADFQRCGGASFKLDPQAILQGRQSLEDAWDFVEAHRMEDVLVYSSESPQFLDAIRETTLAEFSHVLEKTLAALAGLALQSGWKRIVVAGGETSGAVTKALGFASYWIGESVAPGVPVMVPCASADVRLVLKSGNFGQEDFFARALGMMKQQG